MMMMMQYEQHHILTLESVRAIRYDLNHHSVDHHSAHPPSSEPLACHPSEHSNVTNHQQITVLGYRGRPKRTWKEVADEI